MSRPRIIVLLLFLTTLLIYLPAIQNGFIHFDDDKYLVNNVNVQIGVSPSTIRWAFTTSHCSNWHPLTWVSYMLDYQLFRLNPAGYHLTNVLLHAANACLLFILIFRLCGALWPSAFVAAFFALHPLHVESVAWVAELKDVASTFWGLLALLAYVRYVGNGVSKQSDQPSEPSSPASQRSLRYYWLALACFAVSLMFKSMLVTLPFVMLLLDYWPLGRLGQMSAIRRCLIEKVPFVLLSTGVSALTFIAQKATAMASLTEVPLHIRMENAVVAYVGYLGKMIWPVNLAIMYPLSLDIPKWQFIACAAILFFLTVIFWGLRRQQCWLPIGWFWYLGTLVPVIGLVQVGSQAMADRYTYFPLIGITLALSLTVQHYKNRFSIPSAVITGLAFLTLCFCAIRTECQIPLWRDTETLFEHALKITKNNPLCHIKMGEVYEDQNLPDKAIGEYQKALQLNGFRAEIYDEIGQVLGGEGKFDEALPYFEGAIRLKPEAPEFHDSLGIALIELGRLDEAEHAFSEAIRQQPDYAPAHFQMARALLKQNQGSEAVKYFQQALALEPDNLQMLIYVARVLATDKDAAVRNGTEACKFALRAHQLRGGKQPSALDTLAAAYAETGQFDKAVETQALALKTAEASGSNSAEDMAAMRQRLALYQNKQPYRESFGKN